jgi:hypothetical protein
LTVFILNWRKPGEDELDKLQERLSDYDFVNYNGHIPVFEKKKGI